MSGPTSKGRKPSPISGLKPGPVKATLPVVSCMRTDPIMHKSKSSSPITSLQRRFSPDCSLSGQRSPGSLSHKGGSSRGPSNKIANPSCSYMRRTASLDTIYLKGQWPTEAFYLHLGILQVDKSTQTDDGWNDRKVRQPDISTCDDLKFDKYLRHRLRTGKIQGLGLRLISPPILADHSVSTFNSSRDGLESPVHPVAVNAQPRPPTGRPFIRSSLEGLNQEIEGLVLKDFDEKSVTYESIPEGHRAPLADLLRQTRSVNTQTPGGQDDFDNDLCFSGPPSRGSLSPQYLMDVQHGSCGSSPDEVTRLGTSPQINRFLAREPPDGCEKVSLRLEESRRATVDDLPQLKPITAGQFKPSLGSAFQPLQQPTLLNGEVRTPSPMHNE